MGSEHEATLRYRAPSARPARPGGVRAFFTGDWAGAVSVNATGVGIMAALSVLAVLVNYGTAPLRPTVGQVVGLAHLYVGMGAGGWATVSAGAGSVLPIDRGLRPLTLTVVGYGVLAAYFLRRLRENDRTTPTGVALQVCRVAVVHVAALLAVVVLSGVGGSPAGQSVHADLATTLVFGTLTLLVALALAVLNLPDVFTGRAERYRKIIAAPAQAMLYLTGLSCAAMMILLFVIGPYRQLPIEADTGAVLAGFAVILLQLPNLAGQMILIGMGVPAGSVTIADRIDADPRYWLLPAITLVLMVAAGLHSARRSPLSSHGRRVGWCLAVIMPVALLLLALNLTGSASLSGAVRTGRSDAYHPILVVVFGAAYGLVFGLLGAALTPRERSPVAVPPLYLPGSASPTAPTFGAAQYRQQTSGPPPLLMPPYPARSNRWSPGSAATESPGSPPTVPLDFTPTASPPKGPPPEWPPYPPA